MNNQEREQWVLNEEGLYNWFKESHVSMTRFLKENRAAIDNTIKKELEGN